LIGKSQKGPKPKPFSKPVVVSKRLRNGSERRGIPFNCQNRKGEIRKKLLDRDMPPSNEAERYTGRPA